ncbi:MAG: hypothetical protein FDZ69_11785 [Deltaproteobacteria bacterium]|nr:MAG: hypothetical protein FDZ69_11785 [Deltaproteobacteria bacterium]
MKPDCLSERDLILLHYGEAPDRITPEAAADHLASCDRCRSKRDRLAADLRRIPAMADPDPVVATRIAARVSERLAQRPRRWPLVGAAAAGAVALAMAVAVWLPGAPPATTVNRPPAAAGEAPFVGPPQPPTLDLELLERLDLLEEFETLRALEGV